MILYLFLCLLCGCVKEDHPWQLSYIQTDEEAFNSSKLSCLTHDMFNGIDLELIYVEGRLEAYLQVHSQAIAPYRGDDRQAAISIQTQEALLSGLGYRHKGGQRVLLPEILRDHLLISLKNHQSVTIWLEGYKVTIPANQFSKHFKKLQNPPLKNRFQINF